MIYSNIKDIPLSAREFLKDGSFFDTIGRIGDILIGNKPIFLTEKVIKKNNYNAMGIKLLTGSR